MKWYNADKDRLPQNGEEVLTSVEGIYYISIYDETVKGFRLKDEPSQLFVIGEQHIYWAGISNP